MDPCSLDRLVDVVREGLVKKATICVANARISILDDRSCVCGVVVVEYPVDRCWTSGSWKSKLSRDDPAVVVGLVCDWCEKEGRSSWIKGIVSEEGRV